jgi:hypothetical protein
MRGQAGIHIARPFTGAIELRVVGHIVEGVTIGIGGIGA